MKEIDIELLIANKKAHPEVFQEVYDKAIEARIALRYSPKQEIAILRQKDRKPDEYAAYDDYVEKCKAEVKKMFGVEGQ